MPTRRQKRVGELLHEELSDLLQKKVMDPRIGFVTVTAVEVSPDLRWARVFVTSLGDQKALLEGLRHASGFLRRELGQRLSLRYVPDLTFHLDDSFERASRVLNLIQEIEKELNDGQDN